MHCHFQKIAVHILELLKTEDVERHDHGHLYKIRRTPRKIIENNIKRNKFSKQLLVKEKIVCL